jgi:septal ring factor EnvC (AmiA/AmiB activator)
MPKNETNITNTNGQLHMVGNQINTTHSTVKIKYSEAETGKENSSSQAQQVAPELIETQTALLEQHRRTLAVYLKQQALMGHAAPAHVILSIQDARHNIDRIKNILREWDAAVEDLPDDSEA